MKDVIKYSGNVNENYTLVLNPDEKTKATIIVDDNEVFLGEDETMELTHEVNNILKPYMKHGKNYITIKNDGDCLGIIIDVWNAGELVGDVDILVDSFTIWFEDYVDEY